MSKRRNGAMSESRSFSERWNSSWLSRVTWSLISRSRSRKRSPKSSRIRVLSRWIPVVPVQFVWVPIEPPVSLSPVG